MIAPLLAAILAVQPSPPPPTLSEGIRLVEQGDYEPAIATLRAVVAGLAGDPARAPERARANLHLGVAHVALDQAAEAHAAFLSALRDDPRLRVTEERFSPKVVRAFEAARREQRGGRGRGRTALIAGAAGGAAAAAGLALASGDGEELRLSNVRFATPAIECPDGADALPIPYTVVADITAADDENILSVTMTAIIVASPDPEIGFPSNRPVTYTPASVPGGRTTTLRVDSTLLCGNGPGGPARFNEWTARLVVATSAGTLTGETADRMRVVIP